jgi:hypothetical protein
MACACWRGYRVRPTLPDANVVDNNADEIESR